MSDEFYVGYQPKAPPALARIVRRYVIGVMVVTILAAGALLIGQTPFDDAKFDYGVYADHSGVLEAQPYPVLRTATGSFLLVAPGKHGFSEHSPGIVRLKGSLIERGSERMLEVMPGSVGDIPGTVQQSDAESLGRITLRGEIVDSKCWLGVMNPGSGEIHSDCAVRCISGGIPPAFAAADASGAMRVFLLTGSDGRRLNRETLQYAGQRLEISGELVRSGDLQIIRTEPAHFRRNPE